MIYEGSCECCGRGPVNEEGVCKTCWDEGARDWGVLRPGICIKCCDPERHLNHDGLCSWCAMTPEQQSARLRRDWLLLVLFGALALAVISWSA